jgi:hypothetical protein
MAVSFANPDGSAALVNTSAPLPVTLATSSTVAIQLPTTKALSGTTSTSTTLGPFTPVVGRSVLLMLSGNWSGSVQLMRSTDNGLTRLPLTVGGSPWAVFTANCCEAVWDESEAVASLYLQITLTAGTLTYRIAQ